MAGGQGRPELHTRHGEERKQTQGDVALHRMRIRMVRLHPQPGTAQEQPLPQLRQSHGVSGLEASRTCTGMEPSQPHQPVEHQAIRSAGLRAHVGLPQQPAARVVGDGSVTAEGQGVPVLRMRHFCTARMNLDKQAASS